MDRLSETVLKKKLVAYSKFSYLYRFEKLEVMEPTKPVSIVFSSYHPQKY